MTGVTIPVVINHTSLKGHKNFPELSLSLLQRKRKKDREYGLEFERLRKVSIRIQTLLRNTDTPVVTDH